MKVMLTLVPGPRISCEMAAACSAADIKVEPAEAVEPVEPMEPVKGADSQIS